MTITDGQAISIMGTVAVALGTAIKLQWGRIEKMQDRITAAADKCETERAELAGKIKVLEDRVDDCPVKICPNRPSQQWRTGQSPKPESET